MPNKPHAFTGVFIPADGQKTTPLHREYIEGAMFPITFPSHPSDSLTLNYAAALLQCEQPIEATKFYDRDPQIFDWYYQAYNSNNHQNPVNSVANIVKKANTHQLHGDVLIIKNGPLGGAWESSPDVDIATLAQTIWWYRGSGRDVATVFGERGLLRTVHDLSNEL